MARVLVAMSGGVDSSVAALLLKEEGHEVVGVTLKLWGGVSDSGCCSVSDVEDARFVSHQLGLKHLVFNLADAFGERVVSHYVDTYLAGATPNPCIECNRSIKFDLLLARAVELGFDYLATGHHARIAEISGRRRIQRGVDVRKDQSYVIAVMPPGATQRLLLPVGSFTKEEIRRIAAEAGLRTAAKPDSQEVCFIASRSSKEEFLSRYGRLHPARVFDPVSGRTVEDDVPFETVTIGQRRRIGGLGDSMRRYVVGKDPATRTLTVGTADNLLVSELPVARFTDFTGEGGKLAGMLQGSAHGGVVPGDLGPAGVRFDRPARRIAPGQTVVLYRDDLVAASATVTA